MNIRVGDLVTYKSYAAEDLPALVMGVCDDGAGYLTRAATLEVRYVNGDIRRAELVSEGMECGQWRHTSTVLGLCAVCERWYVLTRRSEISIHYTPHTCAEICDGSNLAPLAE